MRWNEPGVIIAIVGTIIALLALIFPLFMNWKEFNNRLLQTREDIISWARVLTVFLLGAVVYDFFTGKNKGVVQLDQIQVGIIGIGLIGVVIGFRQSTKIDWGAVVWGIGVILCGILWFVASVVCGSSQC